MARIFVLTLILALAVGGYWFYQKQNTIIQPQVAKKVAPQRWQVATATPTNRSQEIINQTNASLVLLEDNATDPNATLDNATLAQETDQFLTPDFVQDLANFLVANYFPAHTQRNPGNQGRFDLHIKSANIRYGVDFPGIDVDLVDILESRQQIFNHVLSLPVLEFLQKAYTPLFLESLTQALNTAAWPQASGEQIQLEPQEHQEMLRLLATKMRVLGRMISGLAKSAAMDDLVQKYLQDIEKVNQAHMHFWELQGSGTAAPRDLNAASAQIKSAIQTREISRQRLLQSMATITDPQGMEATELVYLAQWMHRRIQENPQRQALLAQAGELLVKTAHEVDEYAGQP